ncbi:MmcQ/YjbR family DNA-binding protein [Rubellimicrobium sp. CFH 75288]|uniref:MmcQ/YjbR family DNA-binding protein n=1 Tax=Rubellimicrobium sp. CFH 75288 TaxID=2697034 RepID=UPI001411CEE3|nr:MmcQ/YjbR family DNA-binding protein [Rubellimicrobium sp. CFH 75288]NAZ35221.1 MmcQ/YjbR family DNA-binding protein [Rubellimicrobium sp. CFH 75288]
MGRDLVNRICAEMPGAERSDPWGGGHDAWKVGGRMFACIGAVMPGVSVKTRGIEEAEVLIAAGIAARAPYFHRSWVLLPEGTDEGELRLRLGIAYETIRAGLPRRLRDTLGAAETGG